MFLWDWYVKPLFFVFCCMRSGNCTQTASCSEWRWFRLLSTVTWTVYTHVWWKRIIFRFHCLVWWSDWNRMDLAVKLGSTENVCNSESSKSGRSFLHDWRSPACFTADCSWHLPNTAFLTVSPPPPHHTMTGALKWKAWYCHSLTQSQLDPWVVLPLWHGGGIFTLIIAHLTYLFTPERCSSFWHTTTQRKNVWKQCYVCHSLPLFFSVRSSFLFLSQHLHWLFEAREGWQPSSCLCV